MSGSTYTCKDDLDIDSPNSVDPVHRIIFATPGTFLQCLTFDATGVFNGRIRRIPKLVRNTVPPPSDVSSILSTLA